MKQLFILACGVLMISLSSCSTECVCTTSASGEGAEYFPTTTTTVENTGGAKCSDANATSTTAGLTITVSCK